MTRAGLVCLALAALATVACLTAYNRYRWTALEGAPMVEPRAAGCHVDVFDDGQWVDRPHIELGHIVMEFSRSQLHEQGQARALETLRSAACEHGAFVIKDVRALPMGSLQRGLVYQATLATLVDADGQPINPWRADAGAPSAARAAGW